MYNIAVLLTCFNRKAKTVRALNTLKTGLQRYNTTHIDQVAISIFLTDDGCSDGTAEAAVAAAAPIPIQIVEADGNAYWAGGMRLAWRAALASGHHFDMYLLINDDTEFKDNFIEELIATHQFAIAKYGKGGVYAGFISSPDDENDIIYGAKEYSKSIMSKAIDLKPQGVPQECSMTNANILMVAKNVVEDIGILDEAFIHGAADMDYGMRARRAGFPVLTTSRVCGYNVYDHDHGGDERIKVMKMNFKERKEFINKPHIKQYHDSLTYFKRYDKIRYAIVACMYYLNLYWPSLYYKIYESRGH